jgi:hypothetical protein
VTIEKEEKMGRRGIYSSEEVGRTHVQPIYEVHLEAGVWASVELPEITGDTHVKVTIAEMRHSTTSSLSAKKKENQNALRSIMKRVITYFVPATHDASESKCGSCEGESENGSDKNGCRGNSPCGSRWTEKVEDPVVIICRQLRVSAYISPGLTESSTPEWNAVFSQIALAEVRCRSSLTRSLSS